MTTVLAILSDSDRLRLSLSAHRPRSITEAAAPRRSAVAIVLSPATEEAAVLLIKRSARDGDSWSGHVSFPGGMAETSDADLVATARRETFEEVGLDLAKTADHLGRVDDCFAIAAGKRLRMAITPHVFRLEHTPRLHLGDEAQEAFWLPLEPVLDGRIDGEHEYRLFGVRTLLPCWHHQGHMVWGLTHRMLSNLFDIVRANQR